MKAKRKWTGVYEHAVSPNGYIVRWTGRAWIIRDPKGFQISKHDSRAFAMQKAKFLDKSNNKS